MNFLQKLFLPLLLPFLLAIEIFYSLGLTAGYFFYTDDFALIYQLQNKLSYEWPYNNLTAFFYFPFKIFGNDPQGYFILGIIAFYLSSVVLYFFINSLTGNKSISVLTTIIYGTGVIGIDQFTMIVSIVQSINNINICLTLILLILWVRRKKIRYYIMCLFLFWFSIYLFPMRAFPLILFIPIVVVILKFNFEKKFFKKISLKPILYFLPFIFIGYIVGIFSYGSKASNTNVLPSFSNRSVVQLFSFDSIEGLFSIFGKLVLLNSQSNLFFITGIISFVLIFFIGILLIKNNPVVGKSLIIVLFMTLASYLGYFILLPEFDLNNGIFNRYYSTTALMFSSILPIILYSLFKYKNQLLIILIPVYFFIVINMLSLSRDYQKKIIIDKAIPAKKFFKELKFLVPEIGNNSIFYFDVSNIYPAQARYGGIILGAVMNKEVVLASEFGVKIQTIKIINTYPEFKSFLNTYPKNTSFYSFYYDNKGLKRTDGIIFGYLKNGIKKQINTEQVLNIGEIHNPIIEINNKDFPSILPTKIKFNLSIEPLSDFQFSFPYYGFKLSKENYEYYSAIINKKMIFNYLNNREQYYKKVKIEVSSSHVSGKNGKELLLDKRDNTNWISNESDWEFGLKPWIKIDLGENKNIGRINLIEPPERRSTNHKLYVSSDNINWKSIKFKINLDKHKDKDLIVLKFDSMEARFFKIEIDSTENKYPPSVSEVEMVEDLYKNIDYNQAISLLNYPFGYIKNSEEMNDAYNFIRTNGAMKIRSKTNKDEDYENNYFIDVPISFEYDMEYEIPLQARGLWFEGVRVEFNFPALINISNVEISN